MVCLTQDGMEIRESGNVRSEFDDWTGKVQRSVCNDLLFNFVLFFDGREFLDGRDSQVSELLQLKQTLLQASKSFVVNCHPCPCKIGYAWSPGNSHSLRREARHLL